MAINPLYPGYVPEDEQGAPNPLYPGYYTGKALPRKPISRNFLKPIAYTGDDLLMYINSLDADIAGLPSWFGKRFGDDFKDQFKASALPERVTMDVLDDYRRDSLPGALGVSISFDPFDWTDDPVKKAKDVVGKWAQVATGINPFKPGAPDIIDYETRYNQRLWHKIMTDEDNSGDLAKKLTTLRVLNTTEKQEETAPNPLKLTGSNVKMELKGLKVNAYDNFADAAFKYVSNATAPVTRNTTNNAMLQAGLRAVANDFMGTLPQGNDPLQAAQRNAINFFDRKVAVLESVENLRYVTSKFQESTAKYFFQTPLSKEKFTADFGNIEKAVETARNSITAVEALAEQSGGEALKKDVEEYLRSINHYTNYLNNLEGVIKSAEGSILNIGKNPGVVSYAIKQVTSQGMVGKELSGLDTYTTSIQSEMSIKLADEVRYRRRDHKENMASIIENSDKPQAKAVKAYFGRFLIDRYFNQAEGLYETLSGGRVMETIVWNVIKGKFSFFTPATYMNAWMKKHHFLGFNIDDDMVTKAEDDSPIFNFLYKYKFDLKTNVDFSKLGVIENAQIRTELTGFKMGKNIVRGIEGGDHFKIVGVAFMDKLYATDRKTFIDLLRNPDMLDDPAFRKSLGILEGFKWDDAKKQIAAFKAKLDEMMGKFGVDSADQEKYYLAMYALLKLENGNPYSLKISTKFIGFIQRLRLFLNKIQAAIYGIPIIGKALYAWFSWKNVIAEGVAHGFSLLLSGFGAAASGGFALFIKPLLDRFIIPLIKFVTKRVLDFFEAFVVGIFKGDIFRAFEGIEKQVTSLLKVIMYCLCIPLIIAFLLGQGFTGTSMVGQSPIDPTKSTQGYGGVASNGIPNKNNYASITKNVDVDGATNPTNVPNPTGGQSITATYNITITVNQDIPNGCATYYDYASVGQKQVITVNPSSLAGATKGTVLKYTYTAVFGTADANSVVTNIATLDFSACPNADVPSIGAVRAFGIGSVLPSTGSLCTDPSSPLPAQAACSGGNECAIANEAYTIASNLKRGFWCNYNNSPDYPQYWNEAYYESHDPPRNASLTKDQAANDIPDGMFWCNKLVYVTYKDIAGVGLPGIGDQLTGFKSGGNLVWKPTMATPLDAINPGDAVYYVNASNVMRAMKSGGGSGIVYDIGGTVPNDKPGDMVCTTGNNNGVDTEVKPCKSVNGVMSYDASGDLWCLAPGQTRVHGAIAVACTSYIGVGHTGIVYSKTSDSIETVESNSYYLSVTISKDIDTNTIDPQGDPAYSYYYVYGFGGTR